MKLTKQRLREIIKEEMRNLREAKYQEITISLDDFYNVRKLLKPKTKQIVKHPYSTKTFGLKVDKSKANKTLELLIKNKVNPKG